jgi:Gpi18-like mannosyltransferase
MMKRFVVRNAPSESLHPFATSATTDARNSGAVTTSSVLSKIHGNKWFLAFRQILPLYLAIHLAGFVIIACFSVLISHPDFYSTNPPIYTLWQNWDRWDTGHFLFIAENGYTTPMRSAFFPLYPMLIRGTMLFIHSPVIAALLVSNFAGLVMLVVFYQLVCEDFDIERAQRAVLYFSLFPTAFFFLAAYNESLFLCLVLLSFYHMRRGHWWLAGLFGFLAALTRSAGLLLSLPFCYEYFRQHQFQFKNVRFSIISVALVPAGTALFAVYCSIRFGDFLSFSHAQSAWSRQFEPPWYGIVNSIYVVIHSPDFLSFLSLRYLVDLVPDLFILAIIILSVVGPWRFRRDYWAYTIYGIVLYIFSNLAPIVGVYTFPLAAASRYLLEVFPAFIVLASVGKYRIVHFNYLLVAGTSFVALLTLFLMGHWII